MQAEHMICRLTLIRCPLIARWVRSRIVDLYGEDCDADGRSIRVEGVELGSGRGDDLNTEGSVLSMVDGVKLTMTDAGFVTVMSLPLDVPESSETQWFSVISKWDGNGKADRPASFRQFCAHDGFGFTPAEYDHVE